ncbi:hypothetical protein FLONG3_8251 [Fusarium longipes]|uniref:Uncharacterized protein n=1 Tax=Fusarium longipes TaxID=694270 RepID=A0A395S6Y8_9HYPO|nr:hypothetical protein FLONG3_8251 [Fusarium longipes]
MNVMTTVYTNADGPMCSVKKSTAPKNANSTQIALPVTTTAAPMHQNHWSPIYFIPVNKRRVVLYGSATLISRSPTDCIGLTKDVSRRSWPHNLEFHCHFRPDREDYVPLTDLLYWVVDDFGTSRVKLWIADTYYKTDRVSGQAKQKIIEALEQFLSYSKSNTTLILPSCFKPSTKKLKIPSSGKVTFRFLEYSNSKTEAKLTGLADVGNGHQDSD